MCNIDVHDVSDAVISQWTYLMELVHEQPSKWAHKPSESGMHRKQCCLDSMSFDCHIYPMWLESLCRNHSKASGR